VPSRIEIFIMVLCASLLAAAGARAETWQAPVGGKALVLPEGRVACAGTTGDWTIEQDGHAVRPPASDEAIGKSVDAKVAVSSAACSSAPTTLTLASTGRAATIDPNVTLFVDDARVELHGRGLRGTLVRWKAGDRSGEDRCVQPQPEAGGGEKCVVGVGRGLPADASAADLWHAPAGSRDGPDVVTFDVAGRRVARDEMLLHPARVVVASLLPHDVSIDLAGGTAAHIPLVHPEAVVGADCGAASCDVSGNAVVVSGVSSVTSALPVRLRLAARVVLQRGDAVDATPLVQVPVLPCSMSVASGDVLRGVDASRVVVKVDPRCAGEAGSLRWFSAGRALDVLQVVDRSAAYVLLSVGRIDGDELLITATRPDASTVGQARARTRAVPLPRAALTLPPDEPIDFVPTNRPANAQWQRAQGSGELALLPVQGVYDVTTRDGVTSVQGERGAGGFVALRFAWRVPSLPDPFTAADLAVINDPIERPMHEASVSVPLSASKSPIVELVCGVGPSEERVAPGAAAHVAFAERDACRVIFHRERLSPAEGAQHLQLEVEVTRVDGQSRPEAHVSQSFVLRSGAHPRDYWIKGVSGSFDRVTIRVSRGRDVLESDTREEQSVQWSVVFGTGHFRLYGTTAIPTGLYRVSDQGHSGILSLNLGVVMRATWLDGAGHEGFLGLEGGVMAEGLANDTDASGHSLTQIALVTGIGLSVPIANRSLATETSINLHAWFEYEISRDLGGEPGSPFGFVFGPSISIGNVGTNF
jgi:hypothetical protein